MSVFPTGYRGDNQAIMVVPSVQFSLLAFCRLDVSDQSILSTFTRLSEAHSHFIRWLPRANKNYSLFQIFAFNAATVAAAAAADPHYSIAVGAAHIVAQACAFYAARSEASDPTAHTSRCQSAKLPRARQDVQVS